jgi:copper(I)-binding protein
MIRIVLGALAVLVATCLAATAQETKVGDLTISDLWIRATPPKAPSAAGYFTIANSGKEADRLIAASSTLAGKAELHQMAMKGGVMTMRPVKDGITIPAGGKVTLAPDGLHVMFTELKDGLKEGGKFPVTLTFEKAGKVDTFLPIVAIGAKGPGGDMGGMKM